MPRPANSSSYAANPFNPLISVITPSLNAEATIGATIDSIFLVSKVLIKHNFALEHIIIDGGSADGTEAVYASHREKNTAKDPALYNSMWICNLGQGIYPAMNAGLDVAKGIYCHILNADDFIFDPNLYAQSLMAMHRINCSALIGSIVYFKRPSLRLGPWWICRQPPSDESEWKQQILEGLHYPHPGFIARSDFYKQVRFDTRYLFAADYKLMQSMLLRDEFRRHIMICSQPLVAMAKGGLTSTWKAVWLGALEIASINRELGIRGSLPRRYWQKLRTRLIRYSHKYVN